MADRPQWTRLQRVTRCLSIANNMSRLHGAVDIGLTMGLAIALSVTSNAPAQGERLENGSVGEQRCSVDIDRWATALLDDLPAYANRQLVRSGAETRILAAGFPDIDFPVDIGDVSEFSRASEPSSAVEEIARVFFSMAERPRGSAELRSERSYRLLLTRDRGGSWFPQSLDISKPSNLEPTDITEGAIWQAIQQWQHAGCPSVLLPEE